MINTTNIEDVFGELTFPYVKRKNVKLSELPSLTTSLAVFRYIWPVYEPFVHEREVAYVIYLNKSNKVLGRYKVSEGSLEGTVVGCDMIIARALLLQSKGLIFVHNHPSGALIPSLMDIKIVQKIKQACLLFDFSFLDSIIISPDETYYSASDDGKI